MPIEIRQVVIRAQIQDQQPRRPAEPGGVTNRSGRGSNQEQLVQEIVDQVMRALADQKAR